MYLICICLYCISRHTTKIKERHRYLPMHWPTTLWCWNIKVVSFWNCFNSRPISRVFCCPCLWLPTITSHLVSSSLHMQHWISGYFSLPSESSCIHHFCSTSEYLTIWINLTSSSLPSWRNTSLLIISGEGFCVLLAESWHYAFGVSQEAILGKEGDLPQSALNGVPHFTSWSSQKRLCFFGGQGSKHGHRAIIWNSTLYGCTIGPEESENFASCQLGKSAEKGS